MNKLLLLALPVLLGFIVSALDHDRETVESSETETVSDSTLTPMTFESYYKSLPDSVKQVIEEKELYGNLKSCYEKNIREMEMPVFIPDSSLTASMPVLNPPPVDEEMIIPRFRRCPGNRHRR